MTQIPNCPKREDAELIACPYCDALYQRPADFDPHAHLSCPQCGGTLIDGRADFIQSFVFAFTALILFIIANSFPFITLNLQGSLTTISVFDSVKSLFDNGLPVLAVLVLLFIIVMPLWYLLAVIWVVISFRLRFLNRISRKFLHWMHHIAPWNMLEVYLVGVIVTLIKIMTMASVKFDIGFWAFAILMGFSILVNLRFDLNDAIYQAYRNDPRL